MTQHQQHQQLQQHQQQPTAIDPETPINITLQAQEWNIVLGAMGEAPFRLVNPIIQKLMSQVAAIQSLPPNPEDRQPVADMAPITNSAAGD
jgi:hypothetical protein